MIRDQQFQSTRPARGATQYELTYLSQVYISIHAPREGRDLFLYYHPIILHYFNPRAPRGARPRRQRHGRCARAISIHAPREGRDVSSTPMAISRSLFQSTRPARGATAQRKPILKTTGEFQSTRPARGATATEIQQRSRDRHFNPRAPRGARPTPTKSSRGSGNFNPRAPRGARLYGGRFSGIRIFISIHAPREGRDGEPSTYTAAVETFQSTRPARGATSDAATAQVMRAIFQSTRPARGATAGYVTFTDRSVFQSTRPARGATEGKAQPDFSDPFQSTRPARGATTPL